MMVNLPCLMVSCTNFLRPTCSYTECPLSFLTGSLPYGVNYCRLQLLFIFWFYWPALSAGYGYSVDASLVSLPAGHCADAVLVALHTILRLHGLHPFHPLIPHFSLHSSRFNWLYCNHVLLVLHYARYFSCHSLKRKWQPSQAGISYRWTARWNNKRWYGFLCGLLRWISVSGGNVVNLSPKALIFQGYRALFFCENFCFFLKRLDKSLQKWDRCSDKLNHT